MINWTKAIVRPSTAILDAIKVINDASTQICFVLDEQERLIGTITDGDIRRGILARINLDRPVTDIMNSSPTVLSEHQERSRAKILMQERQQSRIPIVTDDGKLIDVISLEDFTDIPAKETSVVILAGGLGMRLRPLTETIPKPMVPVAGRPIMEHLLENLRNQGFRNISIAVNYLSHVIEDYFGDGSRFGLNISYIREEDKLGTCGALWLLDRRPVEPMLVMNGDLLTRVNMQSLLDFHVDQGAEITVGAVEHITEIPFGVLNAEGVQLKSLIEKPKLSHMVNAGIYVLNPSVLQMLDGSKMDMTDLIEMSLNKNGLVSVFAIHEYWRDIGRAGDLKLAEEEIEGLG